MIKSIAVGILIVLPFVHLACAQDAATPYKIVNKYSQDFNTLPGAGSPIGSSLPFSQGVTLPGWWSNQDTYIVSDGSSNVGALYNFGDGQDRAMGAVTSLKKKMVNFGVSLVCDVAVNDVTITFSGQQWREGGPFNETSQLAFDYSVMTSSQYNAGGWGRNGDTTLWQYVAELSVFGNVSDKAGPVRISNTYKATLKTPNMGPGKVLQLRWTSRNHDGLAVDNFVLETTYTPITPEKHPQQIYKTILLYLFAGLSGVLLIGFAIMTYMWRRSVRRRAYTPVESGATADALPVNLPGPYAVYASVRNNVNNNVEQQPLVNNSKR
jgi:hypothetical protein